MMPCPDSWPVDYSAAECALPEDADAETRERRERLEEMAVAFLWAWTGKNLGLCRETLVVEPVDPCACVGARESTFWGRGPYNRQYRRTRAPYLVDGEWYNGPCEYHGAPWEIALPGPVHDIEAVTIGGVPFTGDIHVENRRYLVRVDGEPWPRDGSVTVMYRRGVPVPLGGQIAAGVLTCELEKALNKDRTCSLPQRIQSITRQGVTVGVAIDTFEDVERGRTGIWLIDSWVASMTRPPAPSLVHSPDTGRKGGRDRRVVTWQPTSP